MTVVVHLYQEHELGESQFPYHGHVWLGSRCHTGWHSIDSMMHFKKYANIFTCKRSESVCRLNHILFLSGQVDRGFITKDEFNKAVAVKGERMVKE